MPKRIEYHKGEIVGSYGMIFVEEVEPHICPSGEKKRQAIFICPNCGQKFKTQIVGIKNNHTKSCGCLQKTKASQNLKKYRLVHHPHNWKDLTGLRFGSWTALEYKGDSKWLCKCDCGTIREVKTDNLLQGKSTSCGCSKSKGENLIKSFLFNAQINFESQKTFNNCRNPKTNHLLFFDFYLPDYNCCIEYDGIQHFICEERNWNTQEHFEEVQYRDNIKNEYCKNNKIKLIRISYQDIDNIDNILKKELKLTNIE